MNFPPRIAFDSLGSIHAFWGWVAIVLLGVVGIWGIVLSLRGRQPSKRFKVGAVVAIAAILLQVGMGLWSFAVDGVDPGNQHLFYGVVILFTLSFAYIYRMQFERRPALAYGLLLLFTMGLGIRGIMTFGMSFGS